MDSQTIQPEKTDIVNLDSTLELPSTKSPSRRELDIYLPVNSKSQQDSILQTENFRTPPLVSAAEGFDDSFPPTGLLKASSKSLYHLDSKVIAKATEREVLSYARRRNKRGHVYTVLFLLLSIAGASWLTLNFGDFLAKLSSTFQATLSGL